MNVKQFEQFAVDLSGDVRHAGRQVWLAGLGVVGMAGNTSQAMFDMLVDEGQKIQKHELKRLDKLVSQATDQFNAFGKRVEDRVQATTKATLGRLGLPSRKDVSELMNRVEQLTAKVEALKARRRGANGR
jgi:poly(hydroxyalkanoate) granule-associated protein